MPKSLTMLQFILCVSVLVVTILSIWKIFVVRVKSIQWICSGMIVFGLSTGIQWHFSRTRLVATEFPVSIYVIIGMNIVAMSFIIIGLLTSKSNDTSGS